MLFFGPLHVLFVYAWKRVDDLLERDDAMRVELERRANLAPPGQRSAALAALDTKENRARIQQEVLIEEQKKIQAEAKSNRRFWTIWWAIAIGLYFIVGFQTTFLGCISVVHDPGGQSRLVLH